VVKAPAKPFAGALPRFPRRKVGRLEDGYQASFVALKGNPIQDFENVRTITTRRLSALAAAPSEGLRSRAERRTLVN